MGSFQHRGTEEMEDLELDLRIKELLVLVEIC